jgi:hypothetical protein
MDDDGLDVEADADMRATSFERIRSCDFAARRP